MSDENYLAASLKVPIPEKKAVRRSRFPAQIYRAAGGHDAQARPARK
jgi:hypothetical protein